MITSNFIVHERKTLYMLHCTPVYNCNMIIYRGIVRLPEMRSDVGSNDFPLSLCHLLKKDNTIILTACYVIIYSYIIHHNFIFFSIVLSTVFQNCAVKDVGKDSLMSRSRMAILNTSLLINWLRNFHSDCKYILQIMI